MEIEPVTEGGGDGKEVQKSNRNKKQTEKKEREKNGKKK